ncbi:MAG TPA: ribosome silencing factor [Polyangiaceae bacterium]|nr:ribosome silencing factor [Polyangiaceae bacterium]
MKKQNGTGSGGRSRPPIKSSHEKVLEGGGAKSRAKKSRRGLAGVAPRIAPPRPRAPKKARVPVQPDGDAIGPWSVASETARERATAIAVAALDKKAVGVEILDVAGKVDYADFLVIMTGRSDRHTQALAQGIEEALKKKGVRPMAVEGLPHGSWVLMDFGDVVVHVFQDETRQLYDIEGLWLDAHRLPVPRGSETERSQDQEA